MIPGMVAAQHSGGGKANQYFLRGFNLDHGTDFAGSIDGVPLNMRGHAHMNGYLDINFLIPELVEKVQFYKGTSYAQNGDFSAAGAADFSTYDRTPDNYVEVGRVGRRRLPRNGCWVHRRRRGRAALRPLYEFGDGPFDRPDELQRDSRDLNAPGSRATQNSTPS